MLPIHSPRSLSAQSGFALVKPLAVLSRICILSAFIIPVVGSASSTADGTQSVQNLSSSNSTTTAEASPQKPSAQSVLNAAVAALSDVKTVEYRVRQVGGYGIDNAKLSGYTDILYKLSPMRFRAKFETEDRSQVSLAVCNGRTSKISMNGKVTEIPWNVIEDEGGSDFLNTQELFHKRFFQRFLERGNALYAGIDDVDGELCHVLATVSYSPKKPHSSVSYIWFSAKTGIPRSIQSFMRSQGSTFLTLRWIVSDVRLNPEIPEETFTYVPTANDSMPVAKSAGPSESAAASARPPKEGAEKSLVGVVLPDFPVRTMEWNPMPLSNLKGTATLITFWAPWCGPCIKEMPTFQKLADQYKGRLQIAAIGVKDSRLNIEAFIKKHPEFTFKFLLDGQLGEPMTALDSFFGIQAIPVNVFVDADGTIRDHWVGFTDEDELAERVRKLMGE
jgi:thiol-disulfide isomerase/thioredoxin